MPTHFWVNNLTTIKYIPFLLLQLATPDARLYFSNDSLYPASAGVIKHLAHRVMFHFVATHTNMFRGTICLRRLAPVPVRLLSSHNQTDQSRQPHVLSPSTARCPAPPFKDCSLQGPSFQHTAMTSLPDPEQPMLSTCKRLFVQ